MPIRYHLDEHVESAVAEGLRRRGIDVTTTVKAGLQGAEDPAHLAFALTAKPGDRSRSADNEFACAPPGLICTARQLLGLKPQARCVRRFAADGGPLR